MGRRPYLADTLERGYLAGCWSFPGRRGGFSRSGARGAAVQHHAAPCRRHPGPQRRDPARAAAHPGLSSLWLTLVTDVDTATGRALIDSMTNEVVVRDHSIRDPSLRPHALRCRRAEGARRAQPASVARRPPPDRWWGLSRPPCRGRAPSPPGAFRQPRRSGRRPRRRRRVVIATGISGTGLLGVSLSTKPGSPGSTSLRWLSPARGSPGPRLWTPDLGSTQRPGKRPAPSRGHARPHRRRRLRGLLRRRGWPGTFRCSTRPSVASCATRRGSTALVLLTAYTNGVAEELFFRGALWSAVKDTHPVAKTTLAYAAVTARDPQSRARPQRGRSERAVRPPAPRVRRHPGSSAHPRHLVGPHAELSPAPCSGRPGGPRPLQTDRATDPRNRARRPGSPAVPGTGLVFCARYGIPWP